MNKKTAYINRTVRRWLYNSDYEDPNRTETAKEAAAVDQPDYDWSQYQSDLIENFDADESFKPLRFN